MKLQRDFTIGRRRYYPKGSDVPWYEIYPLFLVHMLVFGGSGFFLAYAVDFQLLFLYVHGGFAILIYTVAYLAIFGRDEVKWMFINAGLGSLGIYSQIDWLLSLVLVDKRASDYPFYVHVIPFLYYVIYTFLVRQAVLDITQSREDPIRKKRAENLFIAFSVAVYAISYYLTSW